MAETRLMDCPKCGRTNVLGYKKEDKEGKWCKAAFTGLGGVAGACLAGPWGFVGGLAAGKMVGDRMADWREDEEGVMTFQFKCPACGHSWVDFFKK